MASDLQSDVLIAYLKVDHGKGQFQFRPLRTRAAILNCPDPGQIFFPDATDLTDESLRFQLEALYPASSPARTRVVSASVRDGAAVVSEENEALRPGASWEEAKAYAKERRPAPINPHVVISDTQEEKELHPEGFYIRRCAYAPDKLVYNPSVVKRKRTLAAKAAKARDEALKREQERANPALFANAKYAMSRLPNSVIRGFQVSFRSAEWYELPEIASGFNLLHGPRAHRKVKQYQTLIRSWRKYGENTLRHWEESHTGNLSLLSRLRLLARWLDCESQGRLPPASAAEDIPLAPWVERVRTPLLSVPWISAEDIGEFLAAVGQRVRVTYLVPHGKGWRRRRLGHQDGDMLAITGVDEKGLKLWDRNSDSYQVEEFHVPWDRLRRCRAMGLYQRLDFVAKGEPDDE